MRRELWLDPGEHGPESTLRAALTRLGYPLAEAPDSAEVVLSARPVTGPWVAVISAGDEDGAATALDAGAIEVLRWPTPDRVLSQVLQTVARQLRFQKNRDQIRRTEKMASLGMMVAGIAHEINTPLGAIASMQHTQTKALTKLGAALDAATEEHAGKLLDILQDANRTIGTAAERVTTIVRRLRSYARVDESERKPWDLHEALEDALLLMQHELKHGFTVDRHFGVLPLVPCYPGRINQVFLNLLMNAKQASTPPATLTLRTGTAPGQAWVAIEDEGHGIASEDLARIFDPGFTTKDDGVGVGLGLAICRQIVDEHRGLIEVESTVGQGTTFTVRIPTDPDAPLSPPTE